MLQLLIGVTPRNSTHGHCLLNSIYLQYQFGKCHTDKFICRLILLLISN